jgi:hypothetical protein
VPKISKKTSIVTRTREKWIIRRGGERVADGVCPVCEAGLITLDEAVLQTGLATRKLLSLSDSGEIHSVDVNSGQLFLCVASLRDFCDRARSLGPAQLRGGTTK